MNNLIEKAKKVQCLISDLDGVLTNGYLYMDNNGNDFKAFHVHDGLGLKLLMSAGIHVAIITASVNPLVEYRMKQLGIEHYFTGQINKQEAYNTIKKRLSLEDDVIAYVGDDLPDLPLIKQAGLGIAVANAVAIVKEFADWQTTLSGGHGAVREICDLILKAQMKENIALEHYLS